VIHETTSPIQPQHEGTTDGYRDTLVLTYRAAGFQRLHWPLTNGGSVGKP
jgi:hypothetical protein